jgi:hypothetical protein
LSLKVDVALADPDTLGSPRSSARQKLVSLKVDVALADPEPWVGTPRCGVRTSAGKKRTAQRAVPTFSLLVDAALALTLGFTWRLGFAI